MKLKKLIFWLIAAAAVITTVFILSSEVNNEMVNKPTIRIGVTLPLSGDLAYIGEPVKKSIQLALKDITQERNLKYNYELIFEDDKLDPKIVLLNYNRFISIYKVSAVMTMWSNAVAISSRTDKDKIINIGCAWGKNYAKGYYNLNHCVFSDEQNPLLIKEMKRLGIKKVGIVYNQTPGDEEIISTLLPDLKKAGFEIVFKSQFKMDQKDYKSEIIKIKKKAVDIVFTTLITPGLEIFSKQAKELGYNPKYTGFDVLRYAPEFFEGQWFITDAPGTKEFTKHYIKETKEKSVTSCVSNLYDSLKILVTGFEDTVLKGDEVIPNNKEVVKTILNLKNFKSATGKIYVDEEGNIHTYPEISVIKNGKTEPIGK